MKVFYTRNALGQLKDVPLPVRKAFYKQVGFLLSNLNHPSLHAKKYDEVEDRWQARINQPSWKRI